jgi:hypothetical protein
MRKISTYYLVIAMIFLLSVSSCKKKTVAPSPCVDVTKLEYQWDNKFTVEQNYTGTNTIVSYVDIFPVGYFTLNAGGTYNVLSDNAPLNGSWDINQTGCQLVLDKATPTQISFSINLLTSDSLTIERKDTVAHVIYTQHYYKN